MHQFAGPVMKRTRIGVTISAPAFAVPLKPEVTTVL